MNIDQEQRLFILSSKVFCPKHPAKAIEFFCKHSLCQEKLFCSNCILKKQTCIHDQNQFFVDISQYLYEQRQFYESQGLSTDEDLYQFYSKLSSSKKQFEFMIENQFMKFSDEIDKLIEQTTSIINAMRTNIKAQLDTYIENHNKSQLNLERKLKEGFSFTFHSKYSTYDEIFRKNQHNNFEGLKQLLTKLNGVLDEKWFKPAKQELNNLINLQVQCPQIDYTQYQNIKQNLKLFEKKITQVGSSIINLKTTLKSSRTKWVSNFSVKKMECVENFSSYHTSPISAMGAVDNNLFIGSQNGEIRVFDTENFECLTAFKAHDSVINQIIAQNRNIITASDDKTIKIWNFSQPVKLKQMVHQPDMVLTGHALSVLCVKFIYDHIMISGGVDQTIRLWDLKDNSSRSYAGHSNDVTCLTSSSQGNIVISGSADKTIKLWRIEKKSGLICQKTLSGHHDSVTSVILIQDGNTLFTSSYDKFIRVWSLYNGECTKVIASQHVGQITNHDLFTNNLLLSSSTDGALRFWDTQSSNCVHNIQINTPIRCFVVVDKKVFVGGENKSIYLCQ